MEKKFSPNNVDGSSDSGSDLHDKSCVEDEVEVEDNLDDMPAFKINDYIVVFHKKKTVKYFVINN